MGTHALLATLLQTPELTLDPKEGAHLAACLANLQRFYPVHVTEKALAIYGVMSAVGMIYGTRIAAILARKAKETRERGNSNVIRPQQFMRQQTAPQPATQAAPQSVVSSPDGDPVQSAPEQATTKPESIGDKVFSQIPPEYI